MKIKYLVPLSLLFLTACNDNEPKQEKAIQGSHPRFSSFEISYTGGWDRGFSFLADSNKIFFSPSPNPADFLSSFVKYGLMPDSICRLIDSTLLLIKNDTSGRSKIITCDDCSIVFIKTITAKDTIDFFQSGDINPGIMRMVSQLEYFIDSSKHTAVNALMLLETARELRPPPPPIKKNK
jgi:hypothetical protein